MNRNTEILKKVSLFEGIDENVDLVLQCMGSEERDYVKGEIILLAGQPVSTVGILLSGKTQIIQEDYCGNRTILSELNSGEIFGEAFASAGIKESTVTVLAKTNTHILFLGIERIINTCSNNCIFHGYLIKNLLKILAQKNIHLNSKNQLLSQRTIEEKVLYYLSLLAKKTESVEFELPFNRSELADYLCVDRSALSRILSKLQKEGMIEFDNNRFKLL